MLPVFGFETLNVSNTYLLLLDMLCWSEAGFKSGGNMFNDQQNTFLQIPKSMTTLCVVKVLIVGENWNILEHLVVIAIVVSAC